MHRFGKSSIWTAAGFAFVSGLLLLPTQSSAQYINIEGMIRGALQATAGNHSLAPAATRA